MTIKTCVSPKGSFIYGVHKPYFTVDNFRRSESYRALGKLADETVVNNDINFPEGSVTEPHADWIFEIPNAFPFRGTTFITKSWADQKSIDPAKICLPKAPEVSLSKALQAAVGGKPAYDSNISAMLGNLPESLLIATAAVSTDSTELTMLAKFGCEFVLNDSGDPIGLKYETRADGRVRPIIHKHQLFETLVNNSYLPDPYKEVMVLRPGVQGNSEVMGDYQDAENQSHIYEYLRRNSYIPWGHYAANMSEDVIRYSVAELTISDITGLRQLYCQRTITRLATELEIEVGISGRPLNPGELESLRLEVLNRINNTDDGTHLSFNRSLWGWNYGYDFAPSMYRLHASHQQIHQQYAMIPSTFEVIGDDKALSESISQLTPYACGDLIENFIMEYQEKTGRPFFEAFIQAIRQNQRIDQDSGKESNLVVYSNEAMMVYVPKAQVSQWELQLITLNPVGNILEADSKTRAAINKGILTAVQVLGAMGARLITSIEYSKRFDLKDYDQRLIISFLPKLPESPGAFSEAQLRWINGHYPEDFAIACRSHLSSSSPPKIPA